MRLEGKRAIVTGSSSGIGRAIAMQLAAEGAKVVVNARGSGPSGAGAIDEVVAEICEAGGTAIGFVGAVQDPATASAIVARCVDAFGGVDILVNNAGVFAASSPVDRCPLDAWYEVLRNNLDGAFLLSREALPRMKAQRWGRIINAGSSAGLGQIGGSGYAASKSALFGLTRAMAADFGPYGITANCYNPEARGAMGGLSDQATFDAILQAYLKRGFYTPAEIDSLSTIGDATGVAPWIAYLCTDQAANLNGQVFAVEQRRVALIDEPLEGRVLARDGALGPWSLAELERCAQQVFPLVNRWPQRDEQALAAWEAG